jgi:hypothetical protein
MARIDAAAAARPKQATQQKEDVAEEQQEHGKGDAKEQLTTGQPQGSEAAEGQAEEEQQPRPAQQSKLQKQQAEEKKERKAARWADGVEANGGHAATVSKSRSSDGESEAQALLSRLALAGGTPQALVPVAVLALAVAAMAYTVFGHVQQPWKVSPRLIERLE